MTRRSNDAQQYVKRGLISQSDFNFLSELDPTQNPKYLSFIIKAYLADTGLDFDLIFNRISEYDTLLQQSKVVIKDIHSFRTFRQFDEYVQRLNNISSTKQLKRLIKKDAEIILDTDDIFIVIPQTFESNCLFGAGTKWCVTSSNNIHWERYFFGHHITFYYIQIRSGEIKKNLHQDLWKVAVAVYPDGKMELFDAADHRIGRYNRYVEQFISIDDFFKTLRLDKSLFKPRVMDERLDDLISYKLQEGTTSLDLSKLGITTIPESIGDLPQLRSLTLSENKIVSLPENIAKLRNLHSLYLFHNQLTNLPVSLENLKDLRWLGLTGNQLSSKTIRELKRKLPDTRIYFD